MLLFKCKCGCFFTIKENILTECEVDQSFACQNCNKSIPIPLNSNLADLKLIFEANQFTVSVIPDNAKVSVDFKV